MRRRLSLAAIVLFLGAVSYAVNIYVSHRREISTDNAYATGDIVNIGAQLDDIILWMGAEEGDFVDKGQPLIKLDGGTPRNRLARAQSDLARTVREVVALKQRAKRREAELRQADAHYQKARNEAERRKALAAKGMVSKEERDVSVLQMDEARAALETAREALAEARIWAGFRPVAEHPKVLTAAALARGLNSQVNKTTIVAPVAGHIAKRLASAGDIVAAGRPLLQLVRLDRIWVEANFKETQLRRLRIGQPARMVSDLYGESVVYQGVTVGTGTGTGAAFALLPAQNATGNWLKIVQRVPVRIALTDVEQIKRYPLPLGAALTVSVDTSDDRGPRLTQAPNPAPVDVSDAYGYWREGGPEMVARIIAENLPARPEPAPEIRSGR